MDASSLTISVQKLHIAFVDQFLKVSALFFPQSFLDALINIALVSLLHSAFKIYCFLCLEENRRNGT